MPNTESTTENGEYVLPEMWRGSGILIHVSEFIYELF
jgi:hypothetical protein